MILEGERGVVAAEVLFLSENSLPEDIGDGGGVGDGDAEIPDFVLRRRRATFEGGEGRKDR